MVLAQAIVYRMAVAMCRDNWSWHTDRDWLAPAGLRALTSLHLTHMKPSAGLSGLTDLRARRSGPCPCVCGCYGARTLCNPDVRACVSGCWSTACWQQTPRLCRTYLGCSLASGRTRGVARCALERKASVPLFECTPS